MPQRLGRYLGCEIVRFVEPHALWTLLTAKEVRSRNLFSYGPPTLSERKPNGIFDSARCLRTNYVTGHAESDGCSSRPVPRI